AHRHGHRIAARGVALGSLEAAVTVPKQDTDAEAVAHSKVQAAIAVVIPHCHAVSIEADGVAVGGLEAAVALSQQDTHRGVIIRAAPKVDHGQIRGAIAIKVAYRQGGATGAGVNSIAVGSLEGAVAVTQQHTHEATMTGGAGHDDVGSAVTIEVR